MATYFTLTERRNTCPACHAENILVGSDLIDGMDICCSRCGSFIGRWSASQEGHDHSQSTVKTDNYEHTPTAKSAAEAEP